MYVILDECLLDVITRVDVDSPVAARQPEYCVVDVVSSLSKTHFIRLSVIIIND